MWVARLVSALKSVAAVIAELCREFFGKWDLLAEFKVAVPVFNQFLASVRNG